jgi:hypothetical protein
MFHNNKKMSLFQGIWFGRMNLTALPVPLPVPPNGFTTLATGMVSMVLEFKF